MDELDNLVFGEIRKLALPNHIQNLKDARNENADVTDKIKIIKKEIENIDGQISRFMDLYGIGKFTIDQVSGKIDPLNETRSKLEKELGELTAVRGELSEDKTIELVQSFDDILERGNFEEIRLTIETLISHIEIDNDDVYIHWKFL